MTDDTDNGWKLYKVSDFAEVVGGGTPSTKDQTNFGEDIPWITPKDLSTHQSRYIARGERSLSTRGLAGSSAKRLPAGTVLVSSRAPIGLTAIAQNEVSTNQGCRSLVLNADIADSEFVYYLMTASTDYLHQHANGTTFMELSGGVFKNLEFMLPPLEDQRMIAEVLGALDDRIEALERTRSTTLELLTAIADVASEETSGRFCRLSELGGHRPGRYLAKEDYDESGRIFVYGSNSVMGCHSVPLYPDPHVVLARIGSNCGAIRLSPVGAWVNNNASAIIPAPNVHVALLYGVIANLDMSAYRGGTGQPFIQTSALMEAQVPDVRLWKEASRYKDSLKSSIDILRQIDLERLELLRSRDLLLPRLVSGELRVAAAEELGEAAT